MAQIQGSGLTPSNQGVWGLQGNSGQNNWLGTSDNTDLIFKVNSQERLRLQTDGTITANGILHTNRLKVEGLTELDSVRTVHIRANRITSQNPGDTLLFFGDSTVVLDHSNNHIYTSYKLSAGESETDRNLRIQCQTAPSPTPAGWTNHTILNQIHGRVGVGTAIPQHKLHVNGNTVITGNLGVGTTSPQHKLDVRKTGGDYALRVQSDGTVIAGQLTGSGSTARMYFGDCNHYIGSAFGKGLSIGTYNAADAIVIQEGTGKVGINVGDNHNFGEGMLEVNGTIRSKKMVAEVAGWPDYVFDESHCVMPMSELSNFIKENNRLPDIPSAEEIETRGLDLGELVKLQMKKIEELTLYILDLEETVRNIMEEIQR